MKQLAILLLLFFSQISFAQNGYMKWNEFPLSDIEMTTYELDKEASAVVLGQTAHAKFEFYRGHEVMSYSYHVRIKILSKAGLDKATIELPYYSHKRLEDIVSIKGTTSTLKDGKIVKTKLTQKDIFSEKTSDFVSQKKFTMPAVEVGSIIEYKYEMISERLTVLEDFYLQREIPIKWAEVTFEVPEFFEYVYLAQTPLLFHIKTNEAKTYNLGSEYYRVNGTKYRWVVKDVPALVRERFITTINDYRQRIRIQLRKVQFPRQPVNNVFSTWENTKKELIEGKNFGLRFLQGNGIYSVVKQCPAVRDTSMGKQQQIQAIYEFVQKNMKWDDGYGYMIDRSFEDLYESKIGDIGEINLMLLSLLKYAGFEANPVLLSTRRHGKVTPNCPVLKQFNYVIVEVMIDGKTLLLDAAYPNLPLGTVSFNCLNGKAWSLRGKEGTWIDIPVKNEIKIIQINLKLEEDGSAKGFIQSIYNGYEAITQRKEALSSREDKYLEERIKEDIPDIKIDSLIFKNTKDSKKKFYETIYFTIPEAAEVAGNMIYFNPLLNEGWEENPFKLKERAYPIDLGHPFREQIIINITPPKGYVIDELPENTMVRLLEKGGSFQFLSKTLPTGDTQMISKLQMSNSKYYPKDYQLVKQFFDMIIDKHSAQLVYIKE